MLPHTSIRLGIVKSDNFGWMVHFSATIETMVAIDWVCCRFFICLYDLNTVCFLSSSSWDVVETQILVRLCLPEFCRENLVNLWILCFCQSNYRNTFEKVHKRFFYFRVNNVKNLKDYIYSFAKMTVIKGLWTKSCMYLYLLKKVQQLLIMNYKIG